jgi:Holliday junction resolvase RusA-like endonuclease
VVVISFTVFGAPAPAGSKRGFYNPKARRVIVTDDSKRSRPWKAQVSDAAAEAMGGAALLEGALRLELAFFVVRPKGHFGTGRNAGSIRGAAPAYPAVKPDLLKLARAVEDALSGIVYRDDAQIVVETLTKHDGEPARVEVRVERVRLEQQAAA